MRLGNERQVSISNRNILIILDQVIVSGANFLTGVIIGRTCAKEQFGLYFIGFSIILIITSVQSSLISSPFTIYSPRLESSELLKYFGSTLLHELALAMLVTLALVGASTLLPLFGKNDLVPVLWALVFGIGFIIFRDYIRSISFAKFEITTALLIDLCVSILQVCGLLLLAHLNKLSASHAYFMIGLASCFPTLYWLIRKHRKYVIEIKQAISDLMRSWSFGKWVFGDYLALVLINQLYVWFLSGFHGVSSVGTFGACQSVAALANPLILGISNILGPITAHAYIEGVSNLRRVILKAINFIAIFMGLFSVFIFIFGGKIIIFLYGDNYRNNNLEISILTLGFFASAIMAPVGYGLWSINRPDVNFKVNIIGIIATLTFGLWFAKYYGVLGAAFGILSINLIILIARYTIFNSFSKRLK